jgi:hypothetical protein
LLWLVPIWQALCALAQVESILLLVLILLKAHSIGNVIHWILGQEAMLVVVQPHVCVGPSCCVSTHSLFARDRRSRVAWLAARLVDVVNIEVRSAALGVTIATMHGLHRARAFTCHVLVCICVGGLVFDLCVAAIRDDFCMTPSVVVNKLPSLIGEIHLDADFIALLVHVFPVQIVAILSATHFDKCVWSWLLQEHIDVTLNLLGG